MFGLLNGLLLLLGPRLEGYFLCLDVREKEAHVLAFLLLGRVAEGHEDGGLLGNERRVGLEL